MATDILGVSGRAMLEALIAGERDPQVLAQPNPNLGYVALPQGHRAEVFSQS